MIKSLDLKTTYESSYLADGDIPNSYEYSNIFYLPQYDKVMAELTKDECYKVNLRVEAIKQIYQLLL